jgi:hypothetical protein
MLHKFIVTLRNHLAPTEWLFVLTAYEMSKGDWIPRTDVVNAAQLSGHAPNISKICGRLQSQGMIELRTVPNRVNGGTIEAKLTPVAMKLIRTAFRNAQQAA